MCSGSSQAERDAKSEANMATRVDYHGQENTKILLFKKNHTYTMVWIRFRLANILLNTRYLFLILNIGHEVILLQQM